MKSSVYLVPNLSQISLTQVEILQQQQQQQQHRILPRNSTEFIPPQIVCRLERLDRAQQQLHNVVKVKRTQQVTIVPPKDGKSLNKKQMKFANKIYQTNLDIAQAVQFSAQSLCFAIRHLANPSRLISEESDWNDLLDLHEKLVAVARQRIESPIVLPTTIRTNKIKVYFARIKMWTKKHTWVFILLLCITAGIGIVAAAFLGPWFALVAMGALAIGTLMEELFCYSIKKHQMFNPKVRRALEQMAEDIRTGKLTPRELVESSVKLAQNIDNICKNVIPTQECPICLEKMEGPEKTPLKPNNPECRHLICRECATHEGTPSHCPICRRPYNELHSICVKCYGKSNKLPSWCCERGHQICPDCNQCDGICPLCLRDLQEERNTEKY